jgi:L-cystine uptake protein TcyP (sodium:dicarboxylate symporter family)
MIRVLLGVVVGILLNVFYQRMSDRFRFSSSWITIADDRNSMSTLVTALAGISLVFVFCVLMPLERVAEHEHYGSSKAYSAVPHLSAREHLTRRGSF